MKLKRRIVGVVGVGHVGAHVAFNLGMMGIADEVRICDKNEQKVRSEAQDLNDAAPFMPNHTRYKEVDYAGLKDCDIIVNAVGNIALLETHDRDKELENSVKEVSSFIPKIMAAGFDGIFVNITNPCDVITNLIHEKSGLPSHRVVGTGTLLDSARLIHVIAAHTGLDARGFTAFMIGEHGNSQMAAWSCISFYGKPLAELAHTPQFSFTKDESQAKAIKGAWVTYVGKGCTEYGVASAGATLVRTILRDEKRILPVSAYLQGEYGERGIYCGIPAIISADGVEAVMEYHLTPEEQLEFKQCCQAIRNNIAKSYDVLI